MTPAPSAHRVDPHLVRIARELLALNRAAARRTLTFVFILLIKNSFLLHHYLQYRYSQSVAARWDKNRTRGLTAQYFRGQRLVDRGEAQ